MINTRVYKKALEIMKGEEILKIEHINKYWKIFEKYELEVPDKYLKTILEDVKLTNSEYSFLESNYMALQLLCAVHFVAEYMAELSTEERGVNETIPGISMSRNMSFDSTQSTSEYLETKYGRVYYLALRQLIMPYRAYGINPNI
jgi:hypothetical protein